MTNRHVQHIAVEESTSMKWAKTVHKITIPRGICEQQSLSAYAYMPSYFHPF